MTWLALSLLCALLAATADALTKTALQRHEERTVVYVRSCWALPFLCLALAWRGWTAPSAGFWNVVAAALPLEILAITLYVKALRLSPLSLTVPYLAFTPVFLLLAGWALLGESATPAGVAGIALITVGALWLHRHRIAGGLPALFRSAVHERGSMLALATAVIFSVTSALGKKAVLASDPLVMSVFYTLLLSVALPAILLVRGGSLRSLVAEPRLFLAIGVVAFLEVLVHFTAISLIQASYMIAAKRASLLFSVLYGYWLFHEGRLPEKLTGAAAMLAGLALIAAAAAP